MDAANTAALRPLPACLHAQSYTPAQGACGYGDLPEEEWPFGGLAAVDPAASPFAAGVQRGCGVCLEVQCGDAAQCGGTPSQPLVVLVTDHCAGCGADAVFLAPSAYRQVVASGLGQVAARFRRVGAASAGVHASAVVMQALAAAAGEGRARAVGTCCTAGPAAPHAQTALSAHMPPRPKSCPCFSHPPGQLRPAWEPGGTRGPVPRHCRRLVATGATGCGGRWRHPERGAGQQRCERRGRSEASFPECLGRAWAGSRKEASKVGRQAGWDCGRCAQGKHEDGAAARSGGIRCRWLMEHRAPLRARAAPAPLMPPHCPQSPDAWLPMQRAFGASWQLSSLPQPPLDLRATDGSGQQVVAR